MTTKVFLGGTCNGSSWRDKLIPMLRASISAFNPVVKDWNAEAQAREIVARETSDINLYCITPKMTGVYSIAEVIDDSNKRPEKTCLIVLPTDDDATFPEHALKSMNQVIAMFQRNGGHYYPSLEAFAISVNRL